MSFNKLSYYVVIVYHLYKPSIFFTYFLKYFKTYHGPLLCYYVDLHLSNPPFSLRCVILKVIIGRVSNAVSEHPVDS